MSFTFVSSVMHGITVVEERIFEGLRQWLCTQKGLDYSSFNNQEHLERAEKKAIMDILLSLDDAYIYNHWSMGTAIRYLLTRVHSLGTLILASTVTTDSLRGTVMFTGEDVASLDAQPIGAAQVLSSGIQIVHDKRYLYANTASGSKQEYLGTVTAWAYHVLLNGSIHPATREPILNFTCKSLEHFNELPKALLLSRTERASLAAALISERPEDEEVVPEDLDDFEEEYSIPDDRSFYALHFEPQQPLIHQVAPALSNFFYDADDMQDYFQTLLVNGQQQQVQQNVQNQNVQQQNGQNFGYIYILY